MENNGNLRDRQTVPDSFYGPGLWQPFFFHEDHPKKRVTLAECIRSLLTQGTLDKYVDAKKDVEYQNGINFYNAAIDMQCSAADLVKRIHEIDLAVPAWASSCFGETPAGEENVVDGEKAADAGAGAKKGKAKKQELHDTNPIDWNSCDNFSEKEKFNFKASELKALVGSDDTPADTKKKIEMAMHSNAEKVARLSLAKASWRRIEEDNRAHTQFSIDDYVQGPDTKPTAKCDAIAGNISASMCHFMEGLWKYALDQVVDSGRSSADPKSAKLQVESNAVLYEVKNLMADICQDMLRCEASAKAIRDEANSSRGFFDSTVGDSNREKAMKNSVRQFIDERPFPPVSAALVPAAARAPPPAGATNEADAADREPIRTSISQAKGQSQRPPSNAQSADTRKDSDDGKPKSQPTKSPGKGKRKSAKPKETGGGKTPATPPTKQSHRQAQSNSTEKAKTRSASKKDPAKPTAVSAPRKRAHSESSDDLSDSGVDELQEEKDQSAKKRRQEK
jgi:hypothetical protein